ncbi:MAG: LysR family transcriptional regulator [Chlamydiota bacterium]|nr:LysR family transcriptional regulator [Chlamydiota bacterium]
MELKLNLTYLKYFHDAALSGSVSESAKRNFVTQSAISQAISKLEKSLSVSLCLHKKQKFKLTNEGELVFNYAKNIFSSVRSLHNAIDHFKEKPTMTLNFVTTHSIGLSLLPNFLSVFQSAFPQITVNFLFGGLSQIRGWLKQGIAEFALVLESADFLEYSSQLIYSGEFALFKHKNEQDNPEARGVYIENREGMCVREFLLQYKLESNRELPIRAELNSWEFIARCLQSGGGYGFIPDFTLLDSRYPQLKLANNRLPKIPYNLCVIHLKGENLSFSAQTFIDNMSAHFKC